VRSFHEGKEALIVATLLQEVPDHSNWKIGMLKVRGMPDETEKQSRMGKGG
jgi:hypothetical protein